MMTDNFAVFILSNGRADKMKTITTLLKQGYTGKYYIIIDNEDKTADEYFKRFKDKVIVYDKLAMSKTFDVGDNFNNRKSVVYGRNACFDIAKDLNLKYFLQLDDDYKSFQVRKIKDNKLLVKDNVDCDKLFNIMIKFLEDSKALTVTIAQGGDFIGGAKNNNFQKGLLRKAMNTFFCKTENRFDFVGNINEDVNTYVLLGQQGKLLFTIAKAQIVQEITQKNKGGMTTIYLDNGTYLKSFYSILFSPSCVTINLMGLKNNKRLHHRVEWNCCTPLIIDEKYKKLN